MPDVVLYLREKNSPLLVEAVTSQEPMDTKRNNEFAVRSVRRVPTYVTAFPDRKVDGSLAQ